MMEQTYRLLGLEKMGIGKAKNNNKEQYFHNGIS